MWQELRDYWLPLMLFVVALVAAGVLLALVAVTQLAFDYLPSLPLLDLFANDATVQRSSVAAAIGLIVTAFVFFRPNASVLARKPSTKKPPQDTMPGA